MFENSKYTAVNGKNLVALYSVIQKIYYPSKNFNPKIDLGKNPLNSQNQPKTGMGNLKNALFLDQLGRECLLLTIEHFSMEALKIPNLLVFFGSV